MNMDVNNSECKEQKNQLDFLELENLIQEKGDVESILNATPALLNIRDATNQTLLHVASKHENLSVMEYLIKAGCDVNAKDNFKSTPIMIATMCKDPSVAKMLLENNADIFMINSDGHSALQILLNDRTLQQVPKVEAFFEKVKSTSTSNEDLLVKLENAGCRLDALVHLRDAEVTRMFLVKKRKLDSEESSSSVYNCMANSCYVDILRILLRYGREINSRRSCFAMKLSWMMLEERDEYLNRIELFVKILIDMNYLDGGICININYMYTTASEKALQILLKADLNSYVKSQFGYDPIAYVFSNRYSGIFEMIRGGMIDTNSLAEDNKTVLHVSVEDGNSENVEYLLEEKKFDPNVADDNGDPPLFFIRVYLCNKCLILLLKYGADIQICNNRGQTLMKYQDIICDPDEDKQIAKTILAHLAMLQSLNKPIKLPFINFIESKEELKNDHSKMCQQLEQMKAQTIHRSLTVYTILTQSAEFISHHVKTIDPDIVSGIHESTNLSEYDPYYIDTIRHHLSLAYKICVTRNDATAIIYNCIDQLRGYHVIVDIICSYIEYDDLRKIVNPLD